LDQHGALLASSDAIRRRRHLSPLNVFRKGDDIVILTELPGIRKADLQIQVKGRTIRLAGAKPVEYGEKASLHRRERLAGVSIAR
jgi:Molecular chaperone (small heat shock protein)